MKTKIFYDFEATSVSKDADPISLGMVAVTDTDSTNMLGKRQRNIKTFYAEFDDFNIDKCDDWVKENVVDKLHLQGSKINIDNNIVKGDTVNIKNHLTAWLSQFESIEFWADFDVIDKPMLIDLIADWNEKKDYSLHYKIYHECRDVIETIAYHNSDKTLMDDFISFYPSKTQFIKYIKTGLPHHLPNIKYDQFFDLHTLFKIKGIDTDISREEFSEVKQQVIPLPFSNYDKSHNALWDSYVSYLCYDKLINYK